MKTVNDFDTKEGLIRHYKAIASSGWYLIRQNKHGFWAAYHADRPVFNAGDTWVHVQKLNGEWLGSVLEVTE